MKSRRPLSLPFVVCACAAILPAATMNAAVNPPAPTAAVAAVSPGAGQMAAAPAKAKDKAAPAKGQVVPPLSPRFQQVRDRIDALLKNRASTPLPPDPRFNPFRGAGSVATVGLRSVGPGAATDAAAAAVVPEADLLLLQDAVATLKVGGVVQRGKVFQLAIRSAPNKEGTYKEGDVINVTLPNNSVHLRVRRVTAHTVTLTLNNAEMTLSF